MATPYIYEKGVLKPYGTAPQANAGTVWKDGRPTVIHAMGDSLTRGQGAESQGGYRGPLWDKLRAAGKNITTTGHRTDPGPGRWSGDGGWRIEEFMSPGTRNWTMMSGADYVRTYPADIILFHIGTNNGGGLELSNAVLAERLSDLLDDMWPYMTKTHMFIAAPILNQNPVWGGTANFSNAIIPMIQKKIDEGRPYHLVRGMDKIVGSANYADTVHLSPAGYTAMAQVWTDALLAEQ